MSKKISIVLPVYNSGRTLSTAIESILSQTYHNYEIIIIDGGSSDNTKQIVEKYADSISVFISEKDEGYADALNKGIKRATGEYYIMLAADDYLLNNALLDFSNEVNPDTDVWCGNMYCFKEGNNITKFNRVEVIDDIRYGKVLAHPACVFKRKAFLVYGYYDINLPINSDRELLLRWYDKGAKFQLSSKYITLFSCRGMSTVNANMRNVNELTDGEKVSIKYGLKPEKAHEIMRKDIIRRKAGKVVKKFFSNSHFFMFIIFWIDGQRPLGKKEITSLNISENYLQDQKEFDISRYFFCI